MGGLPPKSDQFCEQALGMRGPVHLANASEQIGSFKEDDLHLPDTLQNRTDDVTTVEKRESDQ